MAFNMAVACVTVHYGAFDATKGGMEYPLTLCVVLVAMVRSARGGLPFAAAVFANARRQPENRPPLADKPDRERVAVTHPLVRLDRGDDYHHQRCRFPAAIE